MNIYIFKREYTIILAILTVLLSCEKDTVPMNFAPTVTVGSAEDIYRLGATVNGSVINPNGYTVKEFGIQYSLYQSFAESVNVPATEPENFSVLLSGLEPGTGYYYRTYAYSGYNTVYSEARSFTTTSTNAPIFGATTTSNVSLTSFDVHAELLDDGGSDLMLSGFVYKQVESEDITDLTTNTEGAISEFCGTNFSMTIKELYSGSLYAIRPYGVSNGVGYGAIAYVRTKATDKTMLSSCVLSDSTQNSVRVEAHILSAGTHPIVEAGFCYSSENNQPTVNNLHVKTNIENNGFSAVLNGLESGVKYYIRAYTKNENGEYAYSEVAEHNVIKNQVVEITTLTADNITTTSARLLGLLKVENVEIKERGFFWSDSNKQPTLENGNRLVASNDENFSATINIKFGQEYYYRAYVITTDGEIHYGKTLSFKARDILLPVLIVNDVKDITETSVVAGGKIISNGDGIISTIGICWSSTNPMPTMQDNKKSIIEYKENEPFETIINNLTRNTTYYYRAYACNEKGVGYSEVKTFTTAMIVTSAALSTVTIVDISKNAIAVKASITDDGRGTIKEKGFCYIEGRKTPTINNQKRVIASEGVDISGTLYPLLENTEYSICAYAINEYGIAYSEPIVVSTQKSGPTAEDAVYPNL